MEGNEAYDVRGKQSLIFRLYCSDREAFVHMVFYRAAILFAPLAVVAMLWSAYAYGAVLTPFSERFVVVLGVLFIPQLFETLKAGSIISSGGIAFGKLNKSFVRSAESRGNAMLQAYRAAPYIATAVWIAALAWLCVLWLL